MTEKRPLGKIRIAHPQTPEPTEPGRHRRSTESEPRIPKPRTSPEAETPWSPR